MEPLERPILYCPVAPASTPQGPFTITLTGLLKLLLSYVYLILKMSNSGPLAEKVWTT